MNPATLDNQESRAAQRPLALGIAVALGLSLSACSITPRPIGMDARRAGLMQERAELTRDQEPVSGPITLGEAIARALKYNLDYRIKRMEEALAQRQLDIENFDLLPRLTAAAGYSERNNVNAASSRSVITGRQSLEPSTSTDKDRSTVDLGLSWNVLDFGVSYFQARQQADRALVAEERRRKTIHLVTQQVRQAWWQAAGAQQLSGKIEPLLAQARTALADSRRIETERLQAPLEALNYQRQLLDIIRQLEAINDELSQAKPRLAALMTLEPGTQYQLAEPDALVVPEVSIPVEKMEETALLNRPELMEARYNERIGLLETRKAIAKLLPGIEFHVGPHYDSNGFLVNDQWRDFGARMAWNVVNVFNYRNVRRSAELQKKIAHEQKLAVSMAILAQTQIAYREYLGRRRQFELSAEFDGVEQRILGVTRNAARNDAEGRMQEIRASASALMSELRLYQSYGALQGAYGQMISTLGMDSATETLSSDALGRDGQSESQAGSSHLASIGASPQSDAVSGR